MAKATRFTPQDARPLGILGGGQLARMMALKAHEMGVPVVIYCQDANEPAAAVAPSLIGDFSDVQTLKAFLKHCSVVTFESEFLDAELLYTLSRATNTPVWPKPQHMQLLQDRLTQKQFFMDAKLSTSPFLRIDTAHDAERVFAELKYGVVFKRRRFGYDGNGTFIVKTRAELAAFLPELERDEHGFIAEAFIPFRRELAFMAVCGRNGESFTLPLVESHQESSRCLWVKGPLRASNSAKKISRQLLRALEKIGYVGAMGVEIFETRTGELMINEIAPRVHNTGHYTLEALSEDQFTLHVKAVLGFALEKPRVLTDGFAMMNLLGSSDRTPSWRLPADVSLHWYGKHDNRRGRKMGHITALAESPEKALRTVIKARKAFQV